MEGDGARSNCYYEFAYDEPPPSTLLALDESGIVLQSDSFSKNVAPGLRMAWLVGARDTVDALVRVRQDFAVSRLPRGRSSGTSPVAISMRTWTSSALATGGSRDLTTAALRTYCSEWLRFTEPTGGFYFWLELSDAVDWDAARAHGSRPRRESSSGRRISSRATPAAGASSVSARFRCPSSTSIGESPRSARRCGRRRGKRAEVAGG